MSRNSSCSHVQSSPFARRFGCTSAATTSTRSTSSCVVLASSLNSNTMISRRVPVVNFGLSHSFRIELCYGVSEFHKDRVELRPAQESAGSRARTAQYSRNGRLPGRCARLIIIQLSPNMLDQFLEAVKVGSVWAHGSSISPLSIPADRVSRCLVSAQPHAAARLAEYAPPDCHRHHTHIGSRSP